MDSEKAKNLPLWISISENSTTINLDKEKDRDGKSIKVFVYPNRSSLDKEIEREAVEMTVAGTMSYTGKLWNLTGNFDKEEFYFPNGSTKPQVITLKLTPSQDLVPWKLHANCRSTIWHCYLFENGKFECEIN